MKLEDFDAAAVQKKEEREVAWTPIGEGERCAACGHRIFPGTPVFRTEDGRVYHDSLPWRCATRM